MSISSHLLERAYQLIDANQLQNAEMVLDALVRVDPKTYLPGKHIWKSTSAVETWSGNGTSSEH